MLTTSLTGSELRKDMRKWITPPDPSVNYIAATDAHHEGTAAWCTKGNTVADWKTSGSLLLIHGKRTYLSRHRLSLILFSTNDSWTDSGVWEEYSLVSHRRTSYIH
jgi:hypothetical protein